VLTFQSSGIEPVERQRLNKSVKQSFNSDAQSLNTRVSIPTNPAADEERNDKRALCNSTALNLTKSKPEPEIERLFNNWVVKKMIFDEIRAIIYTKKRKTISN
jgi:hypothetical protein